VQKSRANAIVSLITTPVTRSACKPFPRDFPRELLFLFVLAIYGYRSGKNTVRRGDFQHLFRCEEAKGTSHQATGRGMGKNPGITFVNLRENFVDLRVRIYIKPLSIFQTACKQKTDDTDLSFSVS